MSDLVLFNPDSIKEKLKNFVNPFLPSSQVAVKKTLPEGYGTSAGTPDGTDVWNKYGSVKIGNASIGYTTIGVIAGAGILGYFLLKKKKK